MLSGGESIFFEIIFYSLITFIAWLYLPEADIMCGQRPLTAAALVPSRAETKDERVWFVFAHHDNPNAVLDYTRGRVNQQRF